MLLVWPDVARVACCSCKVGAKSRVSCISDTALSYAVEMEVCWVCRATEAHKHANWNRSGKFACPSLTHWESISIASSRSCIWLLGKDTERATKDKESQPSVSRRWVCGNGRSKS